jgi:hypothetical protein
MAWTSVDRPAAHGRHRLQGKPLSRRVLHALPSMKTMAEHVESSESMALLRRVQQFLPSGTSGFEQDIGALAEPDLNRLARALCEFFLVSYAEERGSPDAPPDPTVIQEGL